MNPCPYNAKAHSACCLLPCLRPLDSECWKTTACFHGFYTTLQSHIIVILTSSAHTFKFLCCRQEHPNALMHSTVLITITQWRWHGWWRYSILTPLPFPQEHHSMLLKDLTCQLAAIHAKQPGAAYKRLVSYAALPIFEILHLAVTTNC